MGIINQYRLVVTSLDNEMGSKRFKRYFYFPKNEIGLNQMNERFLEWEKIVHSDLYNLSGKKDTSYYLTTESFKRVEDGTEMSTEIESKRVK